ncbi:uncharacterized protein LOC102446356 isoform X3 [Pelodiscus sinensis]|uniref:uncharacterized protein LOC102446356 isoform X3 n=1 Tax=Pelodiscus sinensis TaxID=13735 RepID=UPI000D71E3F3|nr:uncharacterized protein LOC102446356 isoform X1 [Pelodiscus sinensis]XP_025040159.1 uncharacterized protein LOC102446356 isoform X1 [Pelodiscus sinensis]XP_025040160.1 uncharacterized protein LOC102446356 isoform X1 [Pelodiscus sinensis]XP_025040161.1 uncharacterized protein LOC102446356 isoform X1 [Pelodiscus sinensis]|eukprot:XP_025040158.1 uncharacterized protein LOC102446356 isoform X1 [Pelodiscus sinensis]
MKTCCGTSLRVFVLCPVLSHPLGVRLPPAELCTLLLRVSDALFETYYHLAIAFQRQNLHEEAVRELNKAIEVASIPKLSCQVGCVSRTFLHTPLFARRAYAYVKCGNLKEAIDDANKAVELDPVNPDIYCIRALVWNTVKERKRALFDLNCSQKLKPFNISTLIIKGAIKQSLMAREDPQSLVKNKDHEKAYILDKESKHFFDVEDFHCPKMPEFYDRFLWSLNVPHTIMKVNLLAGSSLMSQLPLDPCHRDKKTDLLPGQKKGSFICSTPTCYLDNSTFARRASYGKILKESGLKLNGSEISERILRITRAASEWSAKKISSNPVKKGSEITETSASTSSGTSACKKPEQKKCEGSKTKSKK